MPYQIFGASKKKPFQINGSGQEFLAKVPFGAMSVIRIAVPKKKHFETSGLPCDLISDASV